MSTRRATLLHTLALGEHPFPHSKLGPAHLTAVHYAHAYHLPQYFAHTYPDSLISLTGSSSDEVTIPSHQLKANANVPDDLSAVDQLWPQLQRLVEPYGLRRRDRILEEKDAGDIRKEADDLRDPMETVAKGS